MSIGHLSRVISQCVVHNSTVFEWDSKWNIFTFKTKISEAKFHSDSLNIAIGTCSYVLIIDFLRSYGIQCNDWNLFNYNANLFIFHKSTRDILILCMPKASCWGKKWTKSTLMAANERKKGKSKIVNQMRFNYFSKKKIDWKFSLLIKANPILGWDSESCWTGRVMCETLRMRSCIEYWDIKSIKKRRSRQKEASIMVWN